MKVFINSKKWRKNQAIEGRLEISGLKKSKNSVLDIFSEK